MTSSVTAPESAEAIDPATTAVLVVDMQNDFASPGGMMDASAIDITAIRETIPPMAASLAAARAAGIPIVFIKMAYEPDLSDFGSANSPNGKLLFGRVSTGSLIRGTWGAEVIDELDPQPHDTSIYKTRFSGFYKTDLDEALARLGVKNLVVVGCTTSICVESTIRDAYFRDYEVTLLADCTAEPVGDEFDRSNHDATLHMVETTFGTVSTSADFVVACSRLRPRIT